MFSQVSALEDLSTCKENVEFVGRLILARKDVDPSTELVLLSKKPASLELDTKAFQLECHDRVINFWRSQFHDCISLDILERAVSEVKATETLFKSRLGVVELGTA